MSAGYINGLGERIVVRVSPGLADACGRKAHGRQQLKPLPEDPFPEGAIAEFPLRISYVKTGNIWLPVAPPPVARPVFLAEQVYGHTGYWVRFKKLWQHVMVPVCSRLTGHFRWSNGSRTADASASTGR